MANRIVNPGAEVDATWWDNFNGTVFTRTTGDFHSGVACFQCDVTAFGRGAAPLIANCPVASPGQRWTYSAWIKSPSGDVYLNLDWINAGNGVISDANTVVTAPANWTFVTLTATAPALTVKARPVVFSGTSATYTYLVDDVFLAPADGVRIRQQFQLRPY